MEPETDSPSLVLPVDGLSRVSLGAVKHRPFTNLHILTVL